MVEILPAILSTNRGDYHKKFKAVEPYVDWMQIDIVDGRFAPQKTIGPKEVGAFRTSKKLEIQLMVNFIEDWLDRFIKIQSVKRIIFPVETAHDPVGIIRHLKRHKVEIGASLNPESSPERLQHIIGYLDTALILSVYPGYSGQHFVHGSFEKIKKIKQMNPNVRVEMDGAISPGTARKAAEEGSDILISGSFVFDNVNIEGDTYHQKVQNALRILRDDVEGLLPSSELQEKEVK